MKKSPRREVRLSSLSKVMCLSRHVRMPLQPLAKKSKWKCRYLNVPIGTKYGARCGHFVTSTRRSLALPRARRLSLTT